MRRIVAILFGALLLYLGACEENDPGYDYLSYSYIDTVLAADTIQNNDLASVVHVYPAGCNHFERIESNEHGDTLELAALYHFHFSGAPCAHGSGLDTTSCRLLFSSSGERFLSYRRSDIKRIVQSIYIRE
jgi:hypothetical protein